MEISIFQDEGHHLNGPGPWHGIQ